jgi:NADH-quinone oxidoreductase subunit J
MNLTSLAGNSLAFYVLALVGLGAAVLTVTVRNMVHGALALAVTLLCVAGLYLTLHADLVAGVQALIYVGAIITLMLVAIMLIHGIADRRIVQTNRNWPLALVVAVGLAGLLLTVVINPGNWETGKLGNWETGKLGNWETGKLGNWETGKPTGTLEAEESLQVQLSQVAEGLLGRYLLPFEVASVLLLVALVGAIVIAQEVRKHPRHEP